MKRVAVCDTGFSSEILSLKNVIGYKNFGSKSKEHGTIVVKSILSINPNCQLILAGINIDSIESVIDAIEWLADFRPDILNISWVTKDKEQCVIESLKKIESNGTKIICAKNEFFKYPWSEFTGIDSSIENDHLANIGTKGSSISCAIYSAKLSLENEGNEIIFSKSRNEQVNLNL